MKLSEFRKSFFAENNYNDEERSNKKAKNLELILDVVKNINNSLILDDVLKVLLTHAIEISDAERGFIVLQNIEGGLEYKLGLDADGIKLPQHHFNISTSVVQDVFETRRPKYIEGAQNDKVNNVSKSIINLSLQTILCAPLVTSDQNLGVIYLDSKFLKKINIREITYAIEILAGQAATAIKNAQLYEELNNAKEQAEKSNKVKSEFLAQMSHEIRTPVNAILCSTGVIKEELFGKLDHELLNFFDITESASKRVMRTIDLVLNMSELQTGTYQPLRKPFDILSKNILPMYQEFRYNAEHKKLEFAVKTETANTKIYADEYSVSQILSNLIDNAIKYTNEGKVEILVFRDKDKRLSVKIMDTGVGISKDFLPHIYKSFTQEYHGYSRKYEGNGLGLALVKKYCEINNAEISVESEKGVGTTFTVVFAE